MTSLGNLIGVGGSGGEDTSLIAVDTEVELDEDEQVTFNVLTDDSTTVGTLAVLQFQVGGTIYQPGTTATIGGWGSLTLGANGAGVFSPLTDVVGTAPAVTVWVTNGQQIRLSLLTLVIAPLNDAPVVIDDIAVSFNGEDVEVAPLENDRDPDGDTVTLLTVNGVTPTVGVPITLDDGDTVTLQVDGSLLNHPVDDTPRSYSYPYEATDGTNDVEGTITVQVGVNLEPNSDPPSPYTTLLDTTFRNHMLTYRGLIGPEYGNGSAPIDPAIYTHARGNWSYSMRADELYGRAEAFYRNFQRTNDSAAQLEFKYATEQYLARLDITNNGANAAYVELGGEPGGNPFDLKYITSIPAWFYQKHYGRYASIPGREGLTDLRQVITACWSQTLQSFGKSFIPGAMLWTERLPAAAVKNCVTAYTETRSSAALQDARDYVTGVLDLATVTGAPLHPMSNHEGNSNLTPITSMWMGSLFAAAAQLLYAVDPEERTSNRIPDFFYRYGTFCLNNGFRVIASAEEPELVGLVGHRLPYYLVAVGQGFQGAGGQADDMMHCLTVKHLIDRAIWAGNLLAEDVSDLEDLSEDLTAGALVAFSYWNRNTPGAPQYRVNPTRFGALWMNTGYSTIFDAGLVPLIPINLTPPAISGVAQVGETITAAPGTWHAQPSPTLAYEWQLDDVEVSGETGTTIEPDDEGVLHAVETATNSAGAASAESNALTITPAGAPIITTHPDNASAISGETAEFSAACTATPTATFQWQYSDDETPTTGTNVSGGTGGSGTGNTTTYETAALGAPQNGRWHRCAFTNAAGTVYTDWAQISLVLDQGSIRFVGDAAGAHLAITIGSAGGTDFAVAFNAYWEGEENTADVVAFDHSGNGRNARIRGDAVFEGGEPQAFCYGTGPINWTVKPPLNTWCTVVAWFTGAAGASTMHASWALTEGVDDTWEHTSGANGIEGSVTLNRLSINGSGSGANGSGNGYGAGIRIQNLRLLNGTITQEIVEAMRQAVDPTGYAMWLVIDDNGGGGVAQRDASGNGHTWTITGGTLATGPTIGSVP